MAWPLPSSKLLCVGFKSLIWLQPLFFFLLQFHGNLGQSIPDEIFWLTSFCQKSQTFLGRISKRLPGPVDLRFYWFQLDQVSRWITLACLANSASISGSLDHQNGIPKRFSTSQMVWSVHLGHKLPCIPFAHIVWVIWDKAQTLEASEAVQDSALFQK